MDRVGTAIDAEARFVVIPVGVGTYRPPALGSRFPNLPKVAKDLRQLAAFFSTEAYASAGFQVLERISGTRTQVNDRLDLVVTGLRKQQEAGAGGPGPVVCLLWSGHGEALQDDDLRLATAESGTPIESNTGFTAAMLVNALAPAHATGVYVILDVCQAGAAGAELTTTAFQRLSDRPPPGGVAQGYAFLCSAQAYEEAVDGLFAGVLMRLLRDGPSPEAQALIDERGFGSMSENDRLLTPRSLGGAMAAEFEVLRQTQARIQQPVRDDIRADFPVFPNPRWTGLARPRTLGGPGAAPEAAIGTALVEVETAMVAPRAAATSKIKRFVTGGGTAGSVLVVKGVAGSGKSTLLHGLPGFGGSFGWSPGGTGAASLTDLPDGGAFVDAGIDVFRSSGHDVTSSLGRALGHELAPGQPDVLFQAVAKRQAQVERPVVVAIDALDDAVDPTWVVQQVVQPLVLHGCRVVVGVRQLDLDDEGLRPFFSGFDLVSLDNAADEVGAYVRRRIAAGTFTSTLTADKRTAVVQAVTERAGDQFLYAQLALDLLERCAPRSLRRLLSALPAGAGSLFDDLLEALDRDFTTRFHLGAGANALALGLAWSTGQGVPRRADLWPLVAQAVGGVSQRLTDEHVSWFVREAGAYVLETSEHDQAVYRLGSVELTEHLRARGDAAAIEGRIADALQQRVQDGGAGPINPYVVVSLGVGGGG